MFCINDNIGRVSPLPKGLIVAHFVLLHFSKSFTLVLVNQTLSSLLKKKKIEYIKYKKCSGLKQVIHVNDFYKRNSSNIAEQASDRDAEYVRSGDLCSGEGRGGSCTKI